MSTTTTTAPGTSQSTAPATRGFAGLRCPLCGSEDVQRLDLDDLDTVNCSACEETYTLDDVRAMLDAWGRVLAWVNQAPTA